MSKISTLRNFVNNGWTIANRRGAISNIGEKNFQELSSLARQANLEDSFSYSSASKLFSQKGSTTIKEKLYSIIAAYKEYAISPYINDFLRTGANLSEKSKNIIDALKFAINNSAVSGKFIRGLSPTRLNKLENIEDVSRFIFENKGFTSVVPEVNADYANCFALGKNGVKVIFDIKNMPGYKASSYEVLFDTNAFTKEKFDIQQIGDKLYKIVQK